MAVVPVPGSCTACGGSTPSDVTVVGTVTTADNHAEDSAHVSGAIGSFSLGVRNDADAVLTSTDLDYSPISVDSTGRVKTSSAANHAEDSAHVSGEIGSFALGVRNDTNAVLTSTDLDYSPLAVDSAGRLKTSPIASVALNSQHRLVADADAAWTPGTDVTGTLTAVTFTVLSGTATVLDSNGTSASLPVGFSGTWSVDDVNSLTGPQSIDAIGGSTYVQWVQK